jgi:two-component system NtrC family sensor kinase
MRGGRPWFLVSVLLPAVLFALAAYFDYRSEVARAQLRVSITTRALSEHAQASLLSVDLVIARVVDRIAGRDPAVLRADRGFHDFLVAIQQSLPQAESVFVVDGDGVLTASSRTFPAPAFDAREREYFIGSREHRRLFVSAPFRGQVAQTFAFTLSRAIERNGTFEGVVAVTVFPSYFSGFYRALLDRPNESTTALVRATDGAVLLRFPESELVPPRLGPSSPLLRAASGEADSGFYLARSTIDGTVRYAGFARLQGLPLIVNFNLDESVVLEAWRSHLLVFAAFALLAAAALIATARLALTGAARERRSLELLLNETRRRHDAEARLHQAQKLEALGRLTGGVAHDFNNLLAAILAGVELTRKRIADPQAIRLLDMSKDAAERGAKLTRQMLAFSRKQEVVPRPLDPNAVIRDAEQLIARTAGSLVRVQLDLPDGVWPILADPIQFEVALLNLVANARDAMPGAAS